MIQDHNDSFTYNIAEYFAKEFKDVQVKEFTSYVRLKELDQDSLLILGPGPGKPSDYPLLLKILDEDLPCPVLGICLGFQAMGEKLGLTLENLNPEYGTDEVIQIKGNDQKKFQVCRYHTFGFLKGNDKIEVLSKSERDQAIMIFKTQFKNWIGIQFHPESIGSKIPLSIILDLFKISPNS